MSGIDGRFSTVLAVALRGLAVGRIALGSAALLAPGALAAANGVRATPELDYMTRVFGARAVALGLGYLSAPAAEASRWQRLGLMVDVLDTVHGGATLFGGAAPRRAAVAMVALTGGYMLVGAAKAAHDLR